MTRLNVEYNTDSTVVSVYALDDEGEIVSITNMGVVAGPVFKKANSVKCYTDGFASVSESDVSWNVVDLSDGKGVMVYDLNRDPSDNLTHDPSFNNVLTFKCDASGTFDPDASMSWFVSTDETYDANTLAADISLNPSIYTYLGMNTDASPSGLQLDAVNLNIWVNSLGQSGETPPIINDSDESVYTILRLTDDASASDLQLDAVNLNTWVNSLGVDGAPPILL